MKMNQKLALRVLGSALCLLGSSAAALPQNASKDDYPRVEIFVGYSALGENPKSIILGPGRIGRGYAAATGFEASVIKNFTRYIGIKGDFSAHFRNVNGRGPVTSCTPTCTTATQDFQTRTRVYNFLGGPEFKARNSTRLTPFAHVLAGLAHTSAGFNTAGPPFIIAQKRSDNSFAMALGGGLDIRATKRVGFRGQIDYNPAFIPAAANGRRDLVRISVGVLFH
jgi:opacity protein-like surface antigen